MTLAGISSYVFQPLSDNAALFQMSESTPVINNMEMDTEFEPAPTGYWASNEVGSTFTNFEPGVYTVVAGDEWGNLVILHFTVASKSWIYLRKQFTFAIFNSSHSILL